MTLIWSKAQAKINLTLDVGEREADGYHAVRTVLQTLSLHDMLVIERAQEASAITLEVSGYEADGVPADSSNLAWRAAALIRDFAVEHGAIGPEDLGLHILLNKRIPSLAGLGGGSSDAAAALRGAAVLLGVSPSAEQMQEFAQALGADVSFFLRGGTALAEGKGELITPLPSLKPHWALMLLKPRVGTSTRQAYDALDLRENRIPGTATEAWVHGSMHVDNDFLAVAREQPEIAAALRFFLVAPERHPDTPPMLCGSGSAVACRVRCERDGEILALRAEFDGLGKAWVTRTANFLP